VVLVGGDFNKLQHQYINFQNSMQAKEWFLAQHFTQSQILIKGSRSMQMEKVLQ
jgi:UDP-N-acetylmuramoyl-tripeptide--D-alanyl-D-alanine ligase